MGGCVRRNIGLGSVFLIGPGLRIQRVMRGVKIRVIGTHSTGIIR